MRDLVIVGAGPAGLTAGIYGKRAGLDTLIIDESGIGGGQVLTTYDVDNYPGLPGISGIELGTKFQEHAEGAGVEIMSTELTGIRLDGDIKRLDTTDGEIECRALIIATGATHNHLGVSGEEELAGMGVSYCATCDGAFFRNRVTAVVGGGDVALEDALFLARGCSKVYLIHRRDEFRGADKLVKAVEATDNIEIIYDSVVDSIVGDGQVEAINIKNVKSGETTNLSVQGVFIAVGTHPTTDYISDLVACDDKGYIIADETCVTNVPGIFAAGDVRTKKLRQIVTAASDGANAVQSAVDYLN
ncbi:MAG: thioredoxin-disulfide reductase [Lachnospiraceae bacterium]|nr:thioredoxin-disulfide reductase [Candidatus Colinaster scatohippi]